MQLRKLNLPPLSVLQLINSIELLVMLDIVRKTSLVCLHSSENKRNSNQCIAHAMYQPLCFNAIHLFSYSIDNKLIYFI